MSAAALEVQGQEEIFAAGASVLLRQQAAEALASHRSRRQRGPAVERGGVVGPVEVGSEAGPSRSQMIASRVTERYAQTPSYRAFLAAEAEEATRRARAAAEIAARSAEAVAAAQMELLEELAASEARTIEADAVQRAAAQLEARRAAERAVEKPAVPVAKEPAAGLTVRLFEEHGSASPNSALQQRSALDSRRLSENGLDDGANDSEEARALDEEITFRQAPTFDVEGSSVSIPGNLLEFPRQLVAARKARPSYALGPLGEDGRETEGGSQLRIFEVDAAEITSTAPIESSAAEWSSIWLDALAKDAPEDAVEEARGEIRPRVVEAASLERRIMASMVDACLMGAGFVVFAAVFAYNATVLPSPAIAGVFGAAVLLGMILLYQTLFFTLSEATPGMRYARIGLCTFDDENPERRALLRRTFATLLAACPLGLGLLWACLDEDGLGWHDRLSGMYQRSY